MSDSMHQILSTELQRYFENPYKHDGEFVLRGLGIKDRHDSQQDLESSLGKQIFLMASGHWKKPPIQSRSQKMDYAMADIVFKNYGVPIPTMATGRSFSVTVLSAESLSFGPIVFCARLGKEPYNRRSSSRSI